MNDLSIRLRNYYAERKLPTWGEIHDAADEIERLQDAKRTALKLADERAIEANGLRAQLASARKAIDAMCDHLMSRTEMTDLKYRLRHPAWSWTEQGGSQLDKEEAVKDMADAADEIDRLEAALKTAQGEQK